jgi:ketosteroid isomerase-like protein
MSDDGLRAGMAAANRIFEEEVIGERDFGALDRVYSRDARILPPGAPMVAGRDAIQDFWRSAAEGMDVTTVRLITLDVTPLGDTAVEVGRGEIETRGGTGPIPIKYVVIWKRDGANWRWHVDIWNASA